MRIMFQENTVTDTLENDINGGNFPFIWAEKYTGEAIQLHWSITDNTRRYFRVLT